MTFAVDADAGHLMEHAVDALETGNREGARRISLSMQAARHAASPHRPTTAPVPARGALLRTMRRAR